jgi:hypothetical protein
MFRIAVGGAPPLPDDEHVTIPSASFHTTGTRDNHLWKGIIYT